MARFVGYYQDSDLPDAVQQGRKVTIKKGTMVKVFGREPKPAGKTYKITVNHIMPGITNIEDVIDRSGDKPRLLKKHTHESNPRVCWAGPGGLWAEADMNDIPEAMDALPSLAEAQRRLGEEASKWAGRCYEIACAFVAAGLVRGTAVYGHFLGRINPESYFGDRHGAPFVQHGWVLLPDGRVFDPTRFGFENDKGEAPYLHVGPLTAEYDEGGNKFRKALRPPPPEFDPSERMIVFSQRDLPTGPWKHVEKLLRIDYTDGEQEPGTLSFEQVAWLANASFEDLQPHAAAIYDALEAVGEEALIPIDNRRKAQRLSRSA